MLNRNRIFVMLATVALVGALAIQAQSQTTVLQKAKLAESTFKELTKTHKLTKIKRGLILKSCFTAKEYESAYNRCLRKTADAMAIDHEPKPITTERALRQNATHNFTQIEREYVRYYCYPFKTYDEEAFSSCLNNAVYEFSRLGGLPNLSEYNIDARTAITQTCYIAKANKTLSIIIAARSMKIMIVLIPVAQRGI